LKLFYKSGKKKTEKEKEKERTKKKEKERPGRFFQPRHRFSPRPARAFNRNGTPLSSFFR
jgi:hypothetical protein